MPRLLSHARPLLMGSCLLFAIAAAAQEPDPLVKPSQEWNEQFGGAVAISGDRAVVSAPFDQSLLGAHATGAVYVYRKSGDAWTLEQVLYPYDFPEHNPQTEFGTSISIDGEVIVVGAPFEDVDAYRRGVVYVFRHDGQQWQPEAKLTQGAYLGAHLFGFSVAVHGDRLVASRVDRRGIHSLGSFSCLNPPTMPGEAIVYDFTGANWEQTAVLEPTDGRGGAWFGNAVALEGDRLAVAAYRWWDPEICDNTDRDRDGIIDGTQRGKVYVYRLEDGQWIGEAELQPENVADGDQFGFSLAMSGNTIIAGAPFTDEVGSRFGAAYTYVLSEGEWALEDAFAGDDTNRNDRFGYAVDIDGGYAVVGAPRHRNGDNTGAMYAFRRANGSWQQGFQVTLDQKTGEFSDPGPLMFGEAVAVSQRDFVIGAPQDPRIDGEIAGVMVGSAWAYTVEKVFRAAVSADTNPNDAVVSLHAAFPNPSSGEATITFELSVPGPASLTLFDVLGRRVAVVADELWPAGEHRVHIDLSSFAAGIYHYRLEADGHVLTRQLTRL